MVRLEMKHRISKRKTVRVSAHQAMHSRALLVGARVDVLKGIASRLYSVNLK